MKNKSSPLGNAPESTPEPGKGELLLYQADAQGPRLEVRLYDESVWLSLNQMAELFQVDKSGISRHLKNVFEGGELQRDSVVAIFATTASDGKTYQVEHFNLDAIISVGCLLKKPTGKHKVQVGLSVWPPIGRIAGIAGWRALLHITASRDAASSQRKFSSPASMHCPPAPRFCAYSCAYSSTGGRFLPVLAHAPECSNINTFRIQPPFKNGSGTPAKRVNGLKPVSRVRIPPSPPFLIKTPGYVKVARCFFVVWGWGRRFDRQKNIPKNILLPDLV